MISEIHHTEKQLRDAMKAYRKHRKRTEYLQYYVDVYANKFTGSDRREFQEEGRAEQAAHAAREPECRALVLASMNAYRFAIEDHKP